MKTRAAVCTGLHEPWKVEEIEVADPGPHEVVVQMVYAGMCHSDEHLRTGDISAPPEVLSMLGVDSMFPIIGGHEGAGIVTRVGPGVDTLAEGDHVAMSFIPACGHCFWCASGRQYLCDLGMSTLAGPMMSDGQWRHHLGDQRLNRMTQLGTFAEQLLANEASLVKIDPAASLEAAALISCGIATGFGSAVDRAKVKPGETVVVIGCGGVGSGAIQGARLAGARAIVAVDPLPFKVERAKEIGATHSAASILEAAFLLPELTEGRMADVVILTPGVLTGDLLGPAVQLSSKDGRVVATAIAPFNQEQVSLNLFNLAMFNQAVLGTVFGSCSPRVQIPNLLRLYDAGLLEIDKLITNEYTLDEVQNGYDDLAAGKNIRGVVKFDT
ncbi:MAG: NDMA-dependent alcohol dehydrogenase [Actinomycetota bacterium]|jgi:S-(hydroxymethyl)glutathione dehydrogenase/alcohol dehydrogenase|nr:NDMA-dependent alcohol dehydrogenase [Actinomycetota bacterium]MDA8293190.1 NDMA-dependent alcohol dehydrogenase [Actinomycetota bacterium]